MSGPKRRYSSRIALPGISTDHRKCTSHLSNPITTMLTQSSESIRFQVVTPNATWVQHSGFPRFTSREMRRPKIQLAICRHQKCHSPSGINMVTASAPVTLAPASLSNPRIGRRFFVLLFQLVSIQLSSGMKTVPGLRRTLVRR